MQNESGLETQEYKERLYFEMYSAAQELYGLRAGTYYAFSQKMDKIFGVKDETGK